MLFKKQKGWFLIMKKEKNNNVLTEEEKKEIMEEIMAEQDDLPPEEFMRIELDYACESVFGITFEELQARHKANGLPVQTLEEAYKEFKELNEKPHDKEAENTKNESNDEFYDLPF